MGLVLALAFSLLGSVGAVAGAAGVLVLQNRMKALNPALLCFATGTLLAASLLAMLPSALGLGSPRPLLAVVLASIIGLFVLERLMIWRHRHDDSPGHLDATGEMILFGDAVHNLMDGFAIGAAFAGGNALGVSTALAVIVHEVAQEVGDFAILLDGGLTRRKAMLYNVLSSLTAVPAAVVAYIAATSVEAIIPYTLAVAAASFLYIALADLVPRHHARRKLGDLPSELLLMGTGIGVIAVLQLVD